jgi:hypothetical protein
MFYVCLGNVNGKMRIALILFMFESGFPEILARDLVERATQFSTSNCTYAYVPKPFSLSLMSRRRTAC